MVKKNAWLNPTDDDEKSEGVGYSFPRKKDGDWLVTNVLIWLFVLGVITIYRFFAFLMPITVEQTTMWYLYVIMAYLGFQALTKSFENATPKLICNQNFSTTSGDYISVGNWAVFRLGMIKAPVIGDIPRNIGTITAPIECINKFGRSVALTVEAVEVEFAELPHMVQDMHSSNGLKGPYFMGLANPEQYTTESDISDGIGTKMSKVAVSTLIEMFKEANKYISFLKKSIKDRGETVEDMVASGARITDRAKGESKQRIKDKIFGDY